MQCQFDAGVVSIAPIRRVGEDVYRTPLRTLYPATATTTTTAGGGGAAAAVASLFVSQTTSTPYVLVGSYDESLSLLDLRKLSSTASFHSPMHRQRFVSSASGGAGVIARREGLGGGVWRVQRGLFSFTSCADQPGGGADSSGLAASSTDESLTSGWVSERNALVLPLMQGGAGLLRYNVLAPASEVFSSAPIEPLPTPSTNVVTTPRTMGGGASGEDLSSVLLWRSSLQGAFSPSPAVSTGVEPLIYDTAVLGVEASPPCRRHAALGESEGIISSEDDKDHNNERQVEGRRFWIATTSFYERHVDVMEWGLRCTCACQGETAKAKACKGAITGIPGWWTIDDVLRRIL